MPSVPKGQCGFAGETSQLLDMYEAEETVHLELFFQWDGVSQMPDCHGPLPSLEIHNTGEVDYEAVFDRTGREHNGDQDIVTITISAGGSSEHDQVLLASYGLADAADVGDVTLRPKTA